MVHNTSLKTCPIENSLKYIGNKWSLAIIRDLFFDKRYFKEFLKANPLLSNKVLSSRLKELEKSQIIKRTVSDTRPVTVTYSLTEKGKSLSPILYELAVYSIKECCDDVCDKNCSSQKALEIVKHSFKK